MRTWLLIIGVAASLVLSPFAAPAADYGTPAPVTGTTPPVAQVLVREGDFAIKLAAELDLGTPMNESVAEDMLVKAGVAPVNGWLSDYPMTPQIIGQLQESISRAASRGTVPMTAEQATKGLYALTAQFDLPTPAGQGPAASAASEPSTPPYPSDQQMINDYYDAGPPIVTYYPPPPDYLYLYDWVPYPVWWFGFWFPGFYICQDFSTIVVFQSRPVVVSNHFIDRDTGTVVRVDPDGHRGRHGGRPETELRTDQGDRFRTFADMHRGVRIAVPSGERRQGEGGRGEVVAGRFGSAEARRGAAGIYSRSTAMMPAPRSAFPRTDGVTRGRNEAGQSSIVPSGGRERGQGVRHARNWPMPSEQRAYSPQTGENGRVWGRHFAEPDRSLQSPRWTLPNPPRGTFPSFNRLLKKSLSTLNFLA